MVNRVLIIDDDIDLTFLLKKCLERENMIVEVVNTGAKGLSLILENEYQLIILDVMLPELDGFSLLSYIRKSSNVPVLMLTAKTDEQDKVKGLKLGADDYLTKPFGLNEFIARVQSLIRRYTLFNNFSNSNNIKICFKGGLSIDYQSRMVTINEEQIDLAQKEFDILFFLATNPGVVFTKKQLYKRIWNDDFALDDNNIMSYISKLRKKIEKNDITYIETIWGVGYRFNQEVCYES